MSEARALVPAATAQSWRAVEVHGTQADKRYASVFSKVMSRDNHTCVYCGLRSKKRQHVHNLDDDHDNMTLSNLACVCPFCHEVNHLGPAGIRRSGKMIFLDEMSQVELNSLCQVLFVAIHAQNEHENDARALYAALEGRAAVLEAELGTAATNPAALGAVLMRLRPPEYAQRGAFIGPMRFLPKMTSFAEDVAYWASERGPVGRYAPQKWQRYAVAPRSLTSTLEQDPLLRAVAQGPTAAAGNGY